MREEHHTFAVMSDPVIIASAARTPLGSLLGSLAPLTASQLGAHALRAALERAQANPEDVSEVLMGCVLPAGQGQAPARQAARRAGLPDSVGATTVNKVCGSGMKAIMLGHDLLLAGSADLVAAGGMESMSNAPHLVKKARAGLRMGDVALADHMMLDGLEDAYEPGRPMGDFGEVVAQAYQFSRGDQDAYATESLVRARNAITAGDFAAEIEGLTVPDRKGEKRVENDEHPFKVSPEKIPALKPAFRPDGTITAASASVNADGAAALVLARRSTAQAKGLPILAEIKAHATHAQEPHLYATAPIPAIRKVLAKAGWTTGEVDLFEINEAFALVAMAAAKELGIPRDRLNIHGGACALGHPIGASGARIVVTLLHALRQRGLSRGVACLCIGGGEATALAIEIPQA
ncbi:MAG TPA: acetyl-CoA C-acyltransferase [Rhizomicrobium sp.]|nr:acetyl-CoA C-acyltransferase [Rhizomicrobium sp.]